MPAGDGNFSWYVGSGGDPEVYQCGPFDTREEAIAVGEQDYADVGFTIVEADRSMMSANVDGDGYAEQIMEDLCENNEECFGEDGPDDPWHNDPQAYRDLSKAIEKVVAEWLAAHPGKTWSFGVSRNEEYFAPSVEESV